MARRHIESEAHCMEIRVVTHPDPENQYLNLFLNGFVEDSKTQRGGTRGHKGARGPP